MVDVRAATISGSAWEVGKRLCAAADAAILVTLRIGIIN